MTFQMWELVEGQGLWQKYKNNVTGETSVKEHELKKVWQSCSNHFFVEEGSSRNVKCKYCGLGKRYVLGMQKLDNGKLVDIKK